MKESSSGYCIII